uniref:ABC transporter permease n=1 Tax=Ningiella ruwaisensis TaxID=2364274 RepID=UPI0010A075F3|nr:ABC transporter permease [Ningiella ruwaisensis]
MRTLFSVLLSSYAKTWFSILMVILSLLIACAGLSAVLIINKAAKQSFSGNSTGAIIQSSYQIVPKNERDGISLEQYKLIKQLGLSQAIGVAEHFSHLYVSKTATDDEALTQITAQRSRIIGIDFLSAMQSIHIQKGNVRQASKQEYEQQSLNAITEVFADDINIGASRSFMHPKYATELSLLNGEAVYSDSAGLKRLPQISTLEIAGLGNDVILNISDYFNLIKNESSAVFPADNAGKDALNREIARFNRILIPYLNDNQVELIQRKLETRLGNKLSLEQTKAQESGAELTQSFHLNLSAMALLMFAVCLFIVLNASNLLIHKRMSMLKILRQLGVSKTRILQLLCMELSLFALVASFFGVLSGEQLAVLASPTIRSIVEGLYQVNVGFTDTPLLRLFGLVFLITLFGVLGALSFSFKRLSEDLTQLKLKEGEKYSYIKAIFAGIILGLAAWLTFYFSQHLSTLLFATAMVILAGCCFLIGLFPFILKAIHRIVSWRFKMLKLGLANAIDLSAYTKIASCAFFIAVTSNIGMNLMVDSFRASTQSWLEQRLVADYYLYSSDAEINAQLGSLARQSDVDLQARFEQQYNLNGNAIDVFSYPTSKVFKQGMVFENAMADVWTRFENENAVIINQQLAIRKSLAPGDTILLPENLGQTPLSENMTEFTVAGVIYDYGNPKGQILLPLSRFAQDNRQASIFALSGSTEQVEAFRTALFELGVNIEERLYTSDALLKTSIEVFDQTFLITDGLNLVTLLVAALSLSCTMVILLDNSRAQTMLLRSIGLSKWQTRRVLIPQFFILCVVALICATPFGILLSHILIYQINYHAFSWTYPLVIDLTNILALYAISLMVVLLVIAIPIVTSTRRSLAQEISWLD